MGWEGGRRGRKQGIWKKIMINERTKRAEKKEGERVRTQQNTLNFYYCIYDVFQKYRDCLQ